MAITLADLEKAVRERKKGKKSMAPDPQEELRAMVRASLAGQAAANEPYMDRARFLTGQGPTPGKDFGFSGEIARERGLGYGDPGTLCKWSIRRERLGFTDWSSPGTSDRDILRHRGIPGRF